MPSDIFYARMQENTENVLKNEQGGVAAPGYKDAVPDSPLNKAEGIHVSAPNPGVTCAALPGISSGHIQASQDFCSGKSLEIAPKAQGIDRDIALDIFIASVNQAIEAANKEPAAQSAGCTFTATMVYTDSAGKKRLVVATLGGEDPVYLLEYKQGKAKAKQLNYPSDYKHEAIDVQEVSQFRQVERSGRSIRFEQQILYKGALKTSHSIGDHQLRTSKAPIYTEFALDDPATQYFAVTASAGVGDPLGLSGIQDYANTKSTLEGPSITHDVLFNAASRAGSYNREDSGVAVIEAQAIHRNQIAISVVANGHLDGGATISQKAGQQFVTSMESNLSKAQDKINTAKSFAPVAKFNQIITEIAESKEHGSVSVSAIAPTLASLSNFFSRPIDKHAAFNRLIVLSAAMGEPHDLNKAKEIVLNLEKYLSGQAPFDDEASKKNVAALKKGTGGKRIMGMESDDTVQDFSKSYAEVVSAIQDLQKEIPDYKPTFNFK